MADLPKRLPPEADVPKPAHDDPPDSIPNPLCDLCGSRMVEHHCRLLCPMCGYQRDCSDP